ncbi:MAG TPA: hypothetical protein DGG94_17465 [Micromonosporaceae bacterium]|nr:hypothetical protein [Micromonosporaceae bacterium]HCU51559.1 hypothetical protein [Micromonosporaceae bacterium]
MTTNRRSAQLLVASCTALTDAIGRHMPAGPYRDFAAWAFSPRNPRRQEFLQATGVTQLINMNTTLLSGLVDESDWPELLRFASLMNAYQVLEVISDNLAFGLGSTSLDEEALQRRTLVSSVNKAMIEALTPDRRMPAVLLLAGQARHVAQFASGFDQSLTATKHADMAEEYARFRAAEGLAAPSLEELEYGVWPALVAGVEVCREVVDALAGTATSGLLRQGLADRYRSVDRTLFAEHLSRLELAALGAQTILVGPTLAYLTGALLEKVVRLRGYPSIVLNGSLSEVLSDAALLVRLQNDIGTRLLRMAPVQQGTVLNGLDGSGSVFEALGRAEDPAFTRLQKDIRNAESNVALWHARRAVGDADARKMLGDSLAYFAGLYAQHSARLTNGLAELDERLADRRASTMIERMVRFHERMYSHRHTESVGEYAI